VDGLPVIFVFAGAIALAILLRLMAGGLDHQRISDYIQSRGGKVVSCHWSPFGLGWFGEKNDRIYEVTYLDGDGNQHQASCKTSFFSGVYLSEDTVVSPAKGRVDRPQVDRTVLELAEENRRLREELERLKGQS
jgi:hypothetical protein